MQTFNWPIRIYYEDTDAGGVVYHSRYLNFYERARTEALRSLGYEQDQLMQKNGIIFAVRSLTIDYKKPALFNQALQVETRINKLSKVSILFAQKLMRDDECLSETEVKVACISATEKKPAVIPTDLMEALSRVS